MKSLHQVNFNCISLVKSYKYFKPTYSPLFLDIPIVYASLLHAYKNGDEASIRSILFDLYNMPHLQLNMTNLSYELLKEILLDSLLFSVNDEDMVCVVLCPETLGHLLNLASNIEQTESTRSGNYSLIYNQVLLRTLQLLNLKYFSSKYQNKQALLEHMYIKTVFHLFLTIL